MSTCEDVVELEPFKSGSYEGHYAIDLHCRYLSERRSVDGQATIPFTSDIDPHHILEEARGTKFVRVMDNVVQYSQLVSTEDGQD